MRATSVVFLATNPLVVRCCETRGFVVKCLRVHPENSFGISPGIPEFEYIKNRFFLLEAVVVPRTTRKRSESMSLLTRARIHAAASHPTLLDACGRSWNGERILPHVQVFRTNLEACSQKVLGNRGGTRKYVAKANVHPGEIRAAESSKRFLRRYL